MKIIDIKVELPPEDEPDMPVRMQMRFNPMPIYFAYRLDTLLPSADYQKKHERKRAIYSLLEMIRRECEEAFDRAERKPQTTGDEPV